MRRLVPLGGVVLLAVALSGCGATPVVREAASRVPSTDKKSADVPAAKDAPKAGPIEPGPSPAPTTPPSKDAAKDGPPRKAMMDEARTGVDRPAAKPDATPAGLLTAGSFDDNLAPQYFRTFAGKVGQNPHLSSLPGSLLGQRLEVRVRNDQGQPVGNARVRVTGADGDRSVELTTRSDGRAVFLLSWDKLPEDGDLDVTATLPGGDLAGTRRVGKDAADCTVVLTSAAAPLPRNLDLGFVLDTTGSMGDELRYLKAEVKGIAAAVKAQFPDVNQRYGLVVYRDEGDEYVTRVFDFTPDLDAFQRNLAAQNAGGGGDIPEAMHRGLDDAAKLAWRKADTARVLFVVADAPPHARNATRTLEAVDRLRDKGVAIYPIAASNSDGVSMEATEFVLRAAALLTGGQYLFLTDDSGVGDAHGEPRIPYYRVEMLDRLMIRVLAGELAGRRNEPDPKDVLRTVGKPPRSGQQD